MGDVRPPGSSRRRLRISRRTAVQLAGVVLGAVFAAVAALFYSSANGSWQQSVREESRRSSLAQETVRAVYGDEAPAAFRIAAAREQARSLRAVRDADPTIAAQPSVAAELAIADQMAFSLSQGVLPGTLAAGDEYALPGGGFDVHRRLADLVPTDAPDPEDTAAEGDRQARTGQLIIAVAVLVTGAAMIAAAVPDRRRRRRRSRHGRRRKRAAENEEPELIPQPGAADRARRRTSGVLLVLWAAGVLLPFAQLALGGEEQRSQAAAARTAVRLTAETATSLARTTFETNILRDVVTVDMAATARELAAIELAEPDAERAVARAEATAAASLHGIAVRMGRAPTPDHLLSRALASTETDWAATSRSQHEQADRAETFGALANDTIALIAIVAAAGAVFEVFNRRT